MLDFLRTNVGFLGHMLDKCLTRTKLRQTLDICCTNARHGTKAGQKLGYHHWKPAPPQVILKLPLEPLDDFVVVSYTYLGHSVAYKIPP